MRQAGKGPNVNTWHKARSVEAPKVKKTTHLSKKDGQLPLQIMTLYLVQGEVVPSYQERLAMEEVSVLKLNIL